MTDPRPLDDLILLHVNDEAHEHGAPGWARHRAIYSLAEVTEWAERSEGWTVMKTGSVEIGTGLGDLSIYKLIVR